ncbi:MAG: DUF2797 domain-containing protein [Gammaproteobacteria bacterium]|nr:DUF2797 domain-containing protein [Gammaproteobacteria bacterium]
MQQFTGPIKKLVSHLSEPITYSLPVGDENIALNPLIGRKISLAYQLEIYCVQCNRKTTKSFQQGYCYPCYRKLMDCNLCIIHPEKCNYPKNECPDTWEHEHCKQDHIIYLANSSGLKIGITRSTQLPTRWIDQGASQAIPLFKVSNRYHSGVVETLFKKYIADKTNWRKMLSVGITTFDMIAVKEELLQKAQHDLHDLSTEHPQIEWLNDPGITLSYPVHQYPPKLTALSLDKSPEITAHLLGIKGQYLLLDCGVINIRKHSGYKVTVTV